MMESGWRDAIVGTGPHAKEQGKHLESGKGNELESPLELPEKKIQPCQHIDFVILSFVFWLCDIYQYKAINLDCFDPPSIKASIKT